MSTNAAHTKFRFASTALAVGALALCLTPLVSAAKSTDDVEEESSKTSPIRDTTRDTSTA